jgi:hypothetical protein
LAAATSGRCAGRRPQAHRRGPGVGGVALGGRGWAAVGRVRSGPGWAAGRRARADQAGAPGVAVAPPSAGRPPRTGTGCSPVRRRSLTWRRRRGRGRASRPGVRRLVAGGRPRRVGTRSSVRALQDRRCVPAGEVGRRGRRVSLARRPRALRERPPQAERARVGGMDCAAVHMARPDRVARFGARADRRRAGARSMIATTMRMWTAAHGIDGFRRSRGLRAGPPRGHVHWIDGASACAGSVVPP